MIKIKRGLDLPISGEPRQKIEDSPPITTVALVGADYIGLKPRMEVQDGDFVKLGQLLFTDKSTDGAHFTSPGCGKVLAINRGPKRAFQSLVIELEGDEEETYQSYYDSDLSTLQRAQVQQNLVAAGLWQAFRTRPYSRIPRIETVPHSIFVTAIDTNPLAPQPEVVLAEGGGGSEFIYGLQVIKRLTDGLLHLCVRPDANIPGRDLDIVSVSEFAGPHPAGLPGTHVHFLDPVSEKKTVWYVNYQDVLAIGRLFVSGRIPVERVISLAGPAHKNPRLVRTRVGASTDDLVRNELKEGENRVISGSVLSGRIAAGPFAYLGRYHSQVSALAEGHSRDFLGWLLPGFDKFSVTHAFAGSFMNQKHDFPMTTSVQGSRRAMVPIGTYEKVMPLDIEPTFLLRSLIVDDTEQARALGCMELDEEDVALCTFVCPGKYEYGPLLRRTLNQIEHGG